MVSLVEDTSVCDSDVVVESAELEVDEPWLKGSNDDGRSMRTVDVVDSIPGSLTDAGSDVGSEVGLFCSVVVESSECRSGVVEKSALLSVVGKSPVVSLTEDDSGDVTVDGTLGSVDVKPLLSVVVSDPSELESDAPDELAAVVILVAG